MIKACHCAFLFILQEADAEDQGGSAEASAAAVEEGDPPHTEKRKRSALDRLLGKTFKSPTRSSPTRLTPEAMAEREVKLYREADPLALSGDPLAWWKRDAHMYPLLAKLAKRYLCVPGTSVPSERVSSTASDIITAQRSAITTRHFVSYLHFILD